MSVQLEFYPLRRNDYQNDSVKIILCNCPGAITGFLCRAPENNSPNIFSCKSPCPVRAHPPPRSLSRNHRDTERRGSYRIRKIIPQKFYYVIAPGALTGFCCRALKIIRRSIFPACNHFDSEGSSRKILCVIGVHRKYHLEPPELHKIIPASKPSVI